jgi:hypothetical protein
MNALLGRVPTSAYRRRVTAKKGTARVRTEAKPKPARFGLTELPLEVIDRMAAEDKRHREALAETRIDSREALLVEWLMDLGWPESKSLRDRFDHGLKGVSERAIVNTHLLVKHICQCLRTNDRSGLSEIDEFVEQLRGRDTEKKRVERAFAYCEHVLAAARAHEVTADEPGFGVFVHVLVNAYPALARDGIRDEVCKRANAIAALKPSATGNRGRGHKGARSLLIELLQWAGMSDARKLVKNALDETVKTKKRTRKSGG